MKFNLFALFLAMTALVVLGPTKVDAGDPADPYDPTYLPCSYIGPGAKPSTTPVTVLENLGTKAAFTPYKYKKLGTDYGDFYASDYKHTDANNNTWTYIRAEFDNKNDKTVRNMVFHWLDEPGNVLMRVWLQTNNKCAMGTSIKNDIVRVTVAVDDKDAKPTTPQSLDS